MTSITHDLDCAGRGRTWNMRAMTENELLLALDIHDALVASYARGALTYSELADAYDSFYPRYALDGHEPDPAPELLEKLASRFSLHREIWEQVLTRTCSEALLGSPGAAGFISAAEAVERIRDLARRHLPPAPNLERRRDRRDARGSANDG
jgi:hypothetical protein